MLLITGCVRRSYFILLAVLVAGFSIPGCNPSGNTENSSSQNSIESVSSTQKTEGGEDVTDSQMQEETSATASSAKEINLEREGITAKIATWEQVRQFAVGQKGKIVVIDIWSTWCFPCVKEYPHLVSLQKKYPEKVVCISFNINYDGSEASPPESNAEEIMDFLVEKNSKLHNFISSTSDEELYEKIDLASIPVAYVYDAEGTLIKRFDNQKQEYGKEGFNYEKHIVPLIERMLKETTK